MKCVYGVEKVDYGWVVWRFNEDSYLDAVLWVLRANLCGTVRWLCSRETAVSMAGEQAMQSDKLIIWEG